MRRLILSLGLAALVALALAPAASASFGFKDFDVTFTNADGSTDAQAGSHPFAMTTSLDFNTVTDPSAGVIPDEAVRDINLAQIPGFTGNQVAAPACSALDFTADIGSVCSPGTQVGRIDYSIVHATDPPITGTPVFNLTPPPGIAARLGFWAVNVPVVIDVRLNPDPPYNLLAGPRNTPQPVPFYGSVVTLWGVPAAPAHDAQRSGDPCSVGGCPAGVPAKAFLTVPRSCQGPLPTTYAIDSWEHSGAYLPDGKPDLTDPNWASGQALTHDASANPLGFTGCGKLHFTPTVAAAPTAKAASSPSGLDFTLNVNNEGLTNPAGLADSDIKKVSFTLPQGMSTNPSVAAGLGVCSPADYANETLDSAPGDGCPNSSTIGTVTVDTPLLDEPATGSLYLAKPYDNPFDSLLALYIVVRIPDRGVIVKSAGEVSTDPDTGQITTTFDDLPQQPYSSVNVHFREGQRSLLATPPNCGTHTSVAHFTPWSDPAQTTTATSDFQITEGPDSGPCPSGGTPPFSPGLTAGSINPNAGSFSPFYIRMTRTDSEQEITSFSADLPPGVEAKLAGVGACSDAAIAAAAAKTGAEETADPSCPAASQVGTTLAGFGVGGVLAYAPGKVYLAGPYHGHPISVVAITSATVGPFDLGTVIVRSAFKIDPTTGQVHVDSAGSDPIPHIIDGIPVHLRDLRVYIDKPNFTLNPTGCDPTSIVATLTGSGASFADPSDDVPATVSNPFQAANCASLGFKPHLGLSLRGGTKRNGHPAATITVAPRPGDANLAGVQITMPRQLQLDQSHIQAPCTRPQFAAGQCPAASIIGAATATSPLLDYTLTGPVYLRTGDNPLPDVVLALHGPPSQPIEVDVVNKIDTVNARLRATAETVPDAPVTKAVVSLLGGGKGLLVNNSSLCAGRDVATLHLTGHNGKTAASNQTVKVAGCKAAHKTKHKRQHRRHRRRHLRRWIR